MPLIGALLAALAPWITRFFLAKGVLMFAGFLGRLGIVLATNELAIEPLTNLVINKWASMPGDMQCWLGLLGVTKAVSIMISAMTLITAKRLFFAKAD